jgi:hypothetical protein
VVLAVGVEGFAFVGTVGVPGLGFVGVVEVGATAGAVEVILNSLWPSTSEIQIHRFDLGGRFPIKNSLQIYYL